MKDLTEVQLQYQVPKEEASDWEAKVWPNSLCDPDDEEWDDQQVNCIACYQPIHVGEDEDWDNVMFTVFFEGELSNRNQGWMVDAHKHCVEAMKIVKVEDQSFTYESGKTEHYHVMTLTKVREV